MQHQSRITKCAAALVLAIAVTTPVAAQTSLKPPAMVVATCETVKPGMGVAHDQHEEKWARAAEGVKGFLPSLAVQAATGPTITCWLTSAPDYAAIGKNNDLFDADPTYSKLLPSLVGPEAQYVSDVRTYVAALRQDLSAGEMPNILTRRFTFWEDWRIRPGQTALFESAAKAYAAAQKRAGIKSEFRIYEVAQGAPDATFWLFQSTATMAGFDAFMAEDPKTFAAFTAEDQKLFDEFFAKAVVSHTSNMWSYSSAQSSLTSEQRATDTFWKRKELVKKP